MTREARIGRRIGGWLSTATNIAIGYVWASRGFVSAVELYVGTLVMALAILGALKFEWKSRL